MTHAEAITYARTTANQHGLVMAIIQPVPNWTGQYTYLPIDETCDMQGWIQTDTINPEIH